MKLKWFRCTSCGNRESRSEFAPDPRWCRRSIPVGRFCEGEMVSDESMLTRRPPANAGMTIGELAVLNLLADVAVAFGQLDEYHPSDMDDAVRHVHALQNIVMGRVAVRAHPNLFYRSGKTGVEKEVGDGG